MVIDLKQPRGVEVARALMARSQVVLQSMRPGVAERIGIGRAAAFEANPDVLYYDVSAFGSGPIGRGMPGYDPLVQAYSGIMQMTGHDGSPPTRCAPSIIDLGTGQWVAMGVLAALLARKQGQPVHTMETALVDTALSVIPCQAGAAKLTGERPRRAGSGNPIASPYQWYRTRDAEILIAAPSQRLWEALLRELDAPRLGAEQAVQWGMIWRHVPAAELQATALALAQRLADAPPGVCREVRHAFHAAQVNGLAAQLDHERLRQRELLDRRSFNEGLRAFQEKRQPDFHRAS